MSTSLPYRSVAQSGIHTPSMSGRRRPAQIGREALAAKIRQMLPRTIVPLLFLLALGVRTWGVRFGLPEYFYHPDEHAIVDRATAILRTGDYNPHWFNYPSTYIYIQALTYIPYFLVSAARGFGDSIPGFTPYGFYFAGRLMTAFIGALTVPLVYALASRMFNRRTGVISSLFLTFSLLHTVHSHYVTTDIPMAFLITLSFMFSFLAMDNGARRHHALAGLFAGLATSTKYPAFVMLLPVLLVQLLAADKGQWGSLGHRIGLILGSFLTGFLLGTPYAILDLSTFLNSVGSVLGHYTAGQPGFEGSDSAVWYVKQMLRSPDGVLAAIGLAGLAWAVLKHTRRDMLLLSFLIPFYVLLALWRVRFERHLVALLPVLLVLAARFLVEAVSWLSTAVRLPRGSGPRGIPQTPLLACLSILAILMPARAVLGFDSVLAERDHRTLAAEWVDSNLPAGSKIVTEALTIPLDAERFHVVQLVRIDSQELEWYHREGVDYIVESDGHWRVLLGQPDMYSGELETYNDIMNGATVLRDFSREVPSSLGRAYPTVLIYHFPEVLILKMD